MVRKIRKTKEKIDEKEIKKKIDYSTYIIIIIVIVIALLALIVNM